jgi:hypothetical protein
MVTDLAASPLRAVTSAPPARLLRVAIFIGAAGLVALLAAVGVLVWTYTGVKDSNQQTVRADTAAARPEAVIPHAAAPSPAPPAPAPAEAAGLSPGPASPTPSGDAGILQNPAMAAIAPTAPGPVSAPAPSVNLPTVKWPTNDDWLSEIANNVDWPALFWSSPSGRATTGAIISAATSTANNAVNLVGNSAVDVFNTLLLANSGVYGGRGDNLVLPAAPSLDLTKLPPPPKMGLPELPPPPKVGLPELPPPPKVGLPELPPPPKVGLPELPPPPKVGLPELPPPPKVELPPPPKVPSITKLIGLPF